MQHAQHIDPLESPLLALLAATESLFAVLAESQSPEEWDAVLDRRSLAFAEVERAASAEQSARSPVTAAARACLDRIAELDAAMLVAGQDGLARLQQERLALGGRRRAVLAHGMREREVARAIAVKA